MIDIHNAFNTSGEPAYDLFQRPGVGYYIPLYQREYSWDRENIDQLMEDICRGVEGLLSDDKIIRFMGTLILVKEGNPSANIQPQDNRALPPRIDNVIDGQQRISTIALLACLLYQRIHRLRNKLPNGEAYDSLREECDSKLSTLLEVFSVDIRRGRPTRKPIIIRGSADKWTLEGEDEENYKSPVSNYIAAVIRAVTLATAFPKFPRAGLVARNLRNMGGWLDKVEKAHLSDDDEFPPAWQILESVSEEYIWSYPRPELVQTVRDRATPPTAVESRVCSLVQLFAFTHYLINRCCFTLIEPISETWAFDMFQSLNATGTPLTAIETFKPLVVNTVAAESGWFKNSKSEKLFGYVDDLLGEQRTAAQKNRMTNEFLTTFALTRDGTKLSSQFSVQRKWLTDRYDSLASAADHEEFVREMGELALYWQRVRGFDPARLPAIPGTDKPEIPEEDRKLTALCVLYLNDAGHKMANTILSRFYGKVLRDDPESAEDFVAACKAVTAFFTIWRSALPNTGLDDVYRHLLKIKGMSWCGDPNVTTVSNLKAHFTESLATRNVLEKEDWLPKAEQNLRYDSARTVCRFALFATAHDTIVDPDEPGLMKVGTHGSREYLDASKWMSDDFKSIEHIAPQNPPDDSEWDPEIYADESYQRIGNLTLLPIEINSSMANKRWVNKWIYYRHLAETDPDQLEILQKEAKDKGVDLAKETLKLLQRTSYKHHITPIVNIGADDKWDKELITKRSKRMCEILWGKISGWLS